MMYNQGPSGETNAQAHGHFGDDAIRGEHRARGPGQPDAGAAVKQSFLQGKTKALEQERHRKNLRRAHKFRYRLIRKILDMADSMFQMRVNSNCFDFLDERRLSTAAGENKIPVRITRGNLFKSLNK